MSFISSLLPTAPGLLPKWQLFVAALAFFNSAQTMVTHKLTRQIYTRTPSEVNPLQSRTFAIWTFIAAIIRLYGAYHVQEKAIYHITMWSYTAALVHFASEWLVFHSASFSVGLLGPLVVASVSLLWMTKQYDYYVVA